MSDRYGSYAWSGSTDGRLAAPERWAESWRGLIALLSARAAGLGRRLGIATRATRVLLSELPQPRSPLVDAAEAALWGAPPWLVAHCSRSYAFGAMLGARDGIAFDAELLLLSALLHDLGLIHREGTACFARRGAERAERLLLDSGASAAAAQAVADAISLHLNVSPSGGPEARLLRMGSGFDVAAQRFDELDRASRRDVVARWPRGELAPELRRAMREQAERHPQTRAGFLCHQLGFLGLIRGAERRFEADHG